MKIGITGHQTLDNDASWNWVEESLSITIETSVKEPNTIIGISSLATGADQLFARTILNLGGRILTVIPFEGYEKTFKEKMDLNSFRDILELSTDKEVLPAKESKEASYFAAGKRVVELSDFMIAVWDGKGALGPGGTGDIVPFARSKNRIVIHLNPNSREIDILGLKREQLSKLDLNESFAGMVR